MTTTTQPTTPPAQAKRPAVTPSPQAKASDERRRKEWAARGWSAPESVQKKKGEVL